MTKEHPTTKTADYIVGATSPCDLLQKNKPDIILYDVIGKMDYKC